jgi:hypothetical protein
MMVMGTWRRQSLGLGEDVRPEAVEEVLAVTHM